ncbi:uncharacterized protein K444DRAFT_663863 [Hyaloscypha bicolor E]|uniref:NmrA-like domain-containing protein n=1 Tax=Hyaloscypha bicolor E TaxID=1095630 RepID=A0A2J6T8W7_9HELO|nr:uncharacterized protein K444DRAFT_663863 [Hyaloscypha bicolor E]PMD59462.1 hypothetical protein K444DRAFT_663863 [Hyaloscypha bicolor E]
MNWKVIYSGIILKDALKTDGILGIDALWASVVIFPHKKETKIAISTYRDIAKSIVEVVNGGEKKEINEVHMCSFMANLDEIVEVVEKEIDKPLERYEGIYEGAKKEAGERMRMGFFDGGVALLGRVAVWNDEVDAWSGWKEDVSERNNGWKPESWKSNQPQSSSLQTATNNHKQTTKKRNTLIIATNPAYPNSQASRTFRITFASGYAAISPAAKQDAAASVATAE